jgi:hypothetical protein
MEKGFILSSTHKSKKIKYFFAKKRPTRHDLSLSDQLHSPSVSSVPSSMEHGTSSMEHGTSSYKLLGRAGTPKLEFEFVLETLVTQTECRVTSRIRQVIH